MAKGVKGLWVRGGTEFILNDAQYAARSDAAQALFWWFGAQVLKCHGEFLPLDYSDPKMIARLRGRTPGTTRKAIDELAAPMPRPLISKMADGRLRILGQREKHGDKIRWIDERAEARAWNTANPGDRVEVDAFSEHIPQGRSRLETTSKKISGVVSHPESTPEKKSQNETGRGTQPPHVAAVTKSTPERSLPVRLTNDQRTCLDVDLDVDLDVQATNQSPPSKPALTCDVLQGETLGNVTTGMILKWMKDPKVFRHWEKLRHKVFAVNASDPVTLLAHVIEINNSRLKSKPATLMMRLTKPRPGVHRRVPADKWFAKAKEILNGSPAEAELKRRKKSKPESLGEILKGGKQ